MTASRDDLLLSIPNFSEGRSAQVIGAIGEALTGASGARLLDVHSDVDHHRTVYTLAGRQGQLGQALVDGAAASIDRTDLREHRGLHPRVGALDVAPIVYLDDTQRGAACAEALTAADRIGTELGVPVFLYGLLTNFTVTRAQLRKGGPQQLQRRIEAGELRPDFGPSKLHPRAGAVLVAARAPLVALNFELAAPADLDVAKAIAARIREGGPEGIPTLRAIGLTLPARNQAAQVSTNIEDFRQAPPSRVADAISRHATITSAELVGLPPRAAFGDFPSEIPVRNLRFLEDALIESSITAS